MCLSMSGASRLTTITYRTFGPHIRMHIHVIRTGVQVVVVSDSGSLALNFHSSWYSCRYSSARLAVRSWCLYSPYLRSIGKLCCSQSCRRRYLDSQDKYHVALWFFRVPATWISHRTVRMACCHRRTHMFDHRMRRSLSGHTWSGFLYFVWRASCGKLCFE